MLAKSKLNSIESLISQALNDMEISHEEFIIILNEKNKYERMKWYFPNDSQYFWINLKDFEVETKK